MSSEYVWQIKKPHENYDRCRSSVKHKWCVLLKKRFKGAYLCLLFCRDIGPEYHLDQEKRHMCHEKLTEHVHLTGKWHV